VSCGISKVFTDVIQVPQDSLRGALPPCGEEIGLHGYVMNCRDGSVEVMVEGEEEALEELLRRLEQGPPGARVEKVEATWGSYTGEFTGFSVRFGG